MTNFAYFWDYTFTGIGHGLILGFVTFAGAFGFGHVIGLLRKVR